MQNCKVLVKEHTISWYEHSWVIQIKIPYSHISKKQFANYTYIHKITLNLKKKSYTFRNSHTNNHHHHANLKSMANPLPISVSTFLSLQSQPRNPWPKLHLVCCLLSLSLSPHLTHTHTHPNSSHYLSQIGLRWLHFCFVGLFFFFFFFLFVVFWVMGLSDFGVVVVVDLILAVVVCCHLQLVMGFKGGYGDYWWTRERERDNRERQIWAFW